MGPQVLDGGASLLRFCARGARHHYTIHRLRSFLKKQRKRLVDPGLSPERRAHIEHQIGLVEASIDRHEYESITPYLRGDSMTGVHETTGAEEGTRGNTQPPMIDEGPS